MVVGTKEFLCILTYMIDLFNNTLDVFLRWTCRAFNKKTSLPVLVVKRVKGVEVEGMVVLMNHTTTIIMLESKNRTNVCCNTNTT